MKYKEGDVITVGDTVIIVDFVQDGEVYIRVTRGIGLVAAYRMAIEDFEAQVESKLREIGQ